MKKKLLASSDTVAGLETSLNSYYYSTQYKIDPSTLQITNSVLGVEKITKLMIFVKLDKNRFKLFQYQTK